MYARLLLPGKHFFVKIGKLWSRYWFFMTLQWILMKLHTFNDKSGSAVFFFVWMQKNQKRMASLKGPLTLSKYLRLEVKQPFAVIDMGSLIMTLPCECINALREFHGKFVIRSYLWLDYPFIDTFFMTGFLS